MLRSQRQLHQGIEHKAQQSLPKGQCVILEEYNTILSKSHISHNIQTQTHQI